MDDERSLSTTEAILGLTLIAGLLLALVGAYIFRFDEETAVVAPEPSWAATEAAPPADASQLQSAQQHAAQQHAVQRSVEQVSYRPVWLAPQSDAEQAVTR